MKADTKENEDNCHVFIDLKQAFDNVIHEELLEIWESRLANATMSKKLQQVLKSLITEQYRNATLNVMGHMIRVTQGVIQGSGLSPNLFNIYLHEVLK